LAAETRMVVTFDRV